MRAPVVAPDASNDMARNSSDTSKARIKIIAYVIVINLLRGLPRRSLNTPKDIISPTPIETIYTIVKELKLPPEAASTWPPSISKSGSATVIRKPSKKLKIAILTGVLEVATSVDIWSPIGFIARSTPHRKMVKPIRSKKLPTINLIITSVFTSTIVKQISKTSPTTGKRVFVTSLVFSKSRLICHPLAFFASVFNKSTGSTYR